MNEVSCDFKQHLRQGCANTESDFGDKYIRYVNIAAVPEWVINIT